MIVWSGEYCLDIYLKILELKMGKIMDTNGCTLIKKKRNERPQRMGIQAVKRARIGLSQYIRQEEKGTTG